MIITIAAWLIILATSLHIGYLAYRTYNSLKLKLQILSFLDAIEKTEGNQLILRIKELNIFHDGDLEDSINDFEMKSENGKVVRLVFDKDKEDTDTTKH